MRIGSKHSEETKTHWSFVRKGKPNPRKNSVKILLICKKCNDPFFVLKCCSKRIFCSKSCAAKNNKHSLGRKHTEEHKKKISEAQKGEKNVRWISDRSKLVKRNRSEPAYIEWRKSIFKRDGFRCRIGNSLCKNNIEAHHILPWRNFPELRYDINNGITLCHFHHPRKESDEKKFEEEFKKIVSQI